MPRFRTNTAIFAGSLSVSLAAMPGYAQSAASFSDPLRSLTSFLHTDPLLLAAFVLAMTLGIGLLLDALRGRFQRSRPAQPATAHVEEAPLPANPMALKRAARLTAQNPQPVPSPMVDRADDMMPEQARPGG